MEGYGEWKALQTKFERRGSDRRTKSSAGMEQPRQQNVSKHSSETESTGKIILDSCEFSRIFAKHT